MQSHTITADYDTMKVFSATKHTERAELGVTVSNYITNMRRDRHELVATTCMQSSDSEFHCVTIIVFMKRA